MATNHKVARTFLLTMLFISAIPLVAVLFFRTHITTVWKWILSFALYAIFVWIMPKIIRMNTDTTEDQRIAAADKLFEVKKEVNLKNLIP